MPIRPLGYESQKAVLQYMDPKCPSIRVAERLVPLKIDNLKFGNMQTEINGTRYQLGVYRHYPLEAPIHHFDDNEKGGSKVDLDQFGLRDLSDSSTVTPGDVDLLRGFRFSTNPNIERKIQSFEYDLQMEEQYLKTMIVNGPGSNSANVHQKLISESEKQIAFFRLELQPLYCKRSNVAPPFTRFLQLTIESEKGKTIERYEYNHKLSEALKYLNTILFGGRCCDIQVNNLHLVNLKSMYRFPIGFKLRVKAIKSDLIEYKLLDDIIHPSSYSTIRLDIKDDTWDLEMYTQLAMKQAKELTIDFSFFFLHDTNVSFFGVLRSLECKNVIIQKEVKVLDYVRLARNWLENGKTIGAVYSFGVKEEETIKKCFKLIKAQHAARVRKDQGRSITFEMPYENSQLRVFYERVLPQPEQFDADGNENTLWNLVFRVEAI